MAQVTYPVLADFKLLQMPAVLENGYIFSCSIVKLEGQVRLGYAISRFSKIHKAVPDLQSHTWQSLPLP